MKPKSVRRRKLIKKELLSAFEMKISPKRSAVLPWNMLGALIQDCYSLPLAVKTPLLEIVSNRSIDGYMGMQSYMDPSLYGSSSEFREVAAVLSFLKKYPFGKVAGLDPDGTARSRFAKAELLCRLTNRRLRWHRYHGFRHKQKWQGLHSIFHTARLMISDWLGPLDLNQIYDYTRHGPGGAIGCTGDSTTSYYKYGAEEYTVTTRALPYALAAVLADPLWRRYVVNPDASLGDDVPSVSESRLAVLKRLRVVDYNKVTFVPKTAQTHRAIAIEPLMNIFLQLGVGDLLAKKLRKVGLDLKNQSTNQQVARLGSSWGGESCLCPITLDLSMASDTLSLELVRELIPAEWFSLLSDLRSPSGLLDGELRPYAKFSSMGNGFTFPLESMIFYALTLSVARHDGYADSNICVYGDDIICPRGMALRLVEVLAYAGFKTNTDKSFFFGPFRESCGKDWFEGRDVRPFFLKREIQNAQDLVFTLNSFGGLYGYLDYDSHFESVWGRIRSYILSQTPERVKCDLLGPRVEDLEGHIHAPWDLANKSRLVLWDVDTQTWNYASVKSTPRIYKRGIDPGPLYLQIVTSNSSGRHSDYSDLKDCEPIVPFQWVSNSVRKPNKFLALELISNITEDIKPSEVVRRNQVKYRLATQTSNGWRND